MHPWLTTILSAALICCAPSAAADDTAARVTLASDGRSAFVIVCPADTLPATLYAARELREFIFRTTGAELPFRSAREEGRPAIRIEVDTSLPRDGFVIRLEGSDLVIAGHDSPGKADGIDFYDPASTGTLYGVYELLERFAGVRFYWPEELGWIVPKLARLEIPSDLHLRGQPHFAYRRLSHGPGWVNYEREHAVGPWGRRLRLGASFGTNYFQQTWHILNIEEWAQRGHPEYAALVGGKRDTSYDPKHRVRNGQVCMSNPEVQAIFIEAARKQRGQMFSASPNDGHGRFCQCEGCRAWDTGRRIPDGKFKGRLDLSDRIVHWYNLIAEQSGRAVGGYAYNEYLEVPAREKLHPNVYISIALNNAWTSADPKERARAERVYTAWGAYSPKATAYDILYHNVRMPPLVAPLGRDVDERIRLIARSGLAGAAFYITPKMEYGGADAYVAAKLLWDPLADGDALRAAYYADLYGPAGDDVAALYDAAAQRWRQAVQTSPGMERQKRVMVAAIDELLAYVARAERAVGQAEPYQARVARLRAAVEGMRRDAEPGEDEKD